MRFSPYSIVVPYELYDWGKVSELYGTIRILHFAGQSVVVVDSLPRISEMEH